MVEEKFAPEQEEPIPIIVLSLYTYPNMEIIYMRSMAGLYGFHHEPFNETFYVPFWGGLTTENHTIK